MLPLRDVEAFVLAGGASTRFGADKAVASVAGRPMLAHALDAARALGLTPRVVTPEWPRYVDFAEAFVISERPGQGPVEGLRAVLRAASAPWALVLAADMPGVTVEVLRALLAPAPGGESARVFEDGDRLHPFPGLYAAELRPAVDALPIDAAMRALLDGAAVLRVSAEKYCEALRNVNRPGDLPDPR